MTSFPYWSSVSRTHNFLSKTSSMNRLRVQPWVPQLAPLWPTSTWSTGNKNLQVLPPPPRFWLRYRKSPHTYQYIQWDSHHHLSAKFSVIHTLSHRASSVCSKPELLQQEKDHLRKALTKCKYLKWALDKVEKRLNKSTRQATDGGTTIAQPATNEVKNKAHIVIPYTQGLCKSIKKICGRYGIQTHFKGSRSTKSLLFSHKDKDPIVNQSGAIYWYQCSDLACDEEYIG